MKVELSRIDSTPTPLSMMCEEYVEKYISGTMLLCGISGISLEWRRSGFGIAPYVKAMPFPDAPEEVVAQGLVAKDAIAQMLAVANIGRIIIGFEKDEEREATHATWKACVEACAKEKARRSGGSSQPDNAADSSSDKGVEASYIPSDASGEG